MKQKNKPAEIEKLNEKMVEIISDFVCDMFYEHCDDCYFYNHEGKCMLSKRIDIDVRKKLIVEWLEVEWLEKEKENEQTL